MRSDPTPVTREEQTAGAQGRVQTRTLGSGDEIARKPRRKLGEPREGATAVQALFSSVQRVRRSLEPSGKRNCGKGPGSAPKDVTREINDRM